EGLGQDAGPRVGASLLKLGVPKKALTFIATHGELDVSHMVEARRMIEQHVRARPDEEAVAYCARAAFELYAAMFDGIWERAGAEAEASHAAPFRFVPIVTETSSDRVM